MNCFNSGLQSLRSKFAKAVTLVAALGLVISPIAAAAQTAPSPQARAAPAARPALYTDNQDISAREFFNLVEYVRGVPMALKDYEMLRDYGCSIAPSAFAAKLTARFVEKGEMCAKSMFDKLDGLNKEGTPLTISYLSGGTLTVVKSVKGINVGQNYLQIETYSLAANSDGKPMSVTYNYHANGGQYMAQMLSSLPGTILGASLPSLVNAAVSGCNGDCQKGIINIVSAGSQSSSVAAVQSSQTTAVGVPGACGSTAPCYTPTPLKPGHTQD